jgi:hypothetical protein
VKIFNNIKKKIGTYILKKESVKHRKNKETISMHEAKNIGILYKVSNEETHDFVVEFIKSLQDKDIDVKALGFIEYKEIPHFCFPKLKHNFLTKRNINWHYKPTGNEIVDFINKEFDILIDLSMENYLPIQFVLSRTNAKFVVGKYYDNTTHYYDMMLKVDDSIKINNFIKVVVDYLNIIKTRKECIPFIKQLELL